MSQRSVDPEVHGADHQVNLHHFNRSGLRLGRETEGEGKMPETKVQKKKTGNTLKIFYEFPLLHPFPDLS
jgi:hypothetical protein